MGFRRTNKYEYKKPRGHISPYIIATITSNTGDSVAGLLPLRVKIAVIDAMTAIRV